MSRRTRANDDPTSRRCIQQTLQSIIQALWVPSTCPEFPTAARSRLRFPLRSCRACGRNSWRRGEICTWRRFQQRCLGGKISNGRVSGPGSRCPHGRSSLPLIAVAAELCSAGSRSAMSTRSWSHRAIQAPSRAIVQFAFQVLGCSWGWDGDTYCTVQEFFSMGRSVDMLHGEKPEADNGG